MDCSIFCGHQLPGATLQICACTQPLLTLFYLIFLAAAAISVPQLTSPGQFSSMCVEKASGVCFVAVVETSGEEGGKGMLGFAPVEGRSGLLAFILTLCVALPTLLCLVLSALGCPVSCSVSGAAEQVAQLQLAAGRSYIKTELGANLGMGGSISAFRIPMYWGFQLALFLDCSI